MKPLDFNTAFKYPFNRATGMWNILWVLVPIIGWFALGGYSVRIVQEFSKGHFKQLPTMKFGDDLGLGFMMFLKAIPFMIVYAIFLGVLSETIAALSLPEWFVAIVDVVIGIFALPMLGINFLNKETVGSFFEFRVVKPVFEHFWDYVMAMLKSILLGIIFMLMWIVLVGLPAGAFTKNIFLADFYRRRVR